MFSVHSPKPPRTLTSILIIYHSALQILMGRILDGREMLAEYFSFGVTEDGKVESLPSLLEGYTPDLCRLPAFLMRVGACVRPGLSSIIPNQVCTDSLGLRFLTCRSTGGTNRSASRHS